MPHEHRKIDTRTTPLDDRDQTQTLASVTVVSDTLPHSLRGRAHQTLSVFRAPEGPQAPAGGARALYIRTPRCGVRAVVPATLHSWAPRPCSGARRAPRSKDHLLAVPIDRRGGPP